MKLIGDLSPTARLTREQIALDVKCLCECTRKHSIAYRGQAKATIRDCIEMGMTIEADQLRKEAKL